jgi:hypothetical protein
LIVLDGYFDESGTHQGSDTIVVAGYLAHADAWRAFESQWKAALREYGLPLFHMSRFAQKAEGYAWPEEVRRERLGNLISIINNHTLHSVGVALPKKLFDTVFTGTVRRAIGGAYGFAAWLVVLMTARDLGQLPIETGVSYVFEDGAPRKGELIAAYDWLAKLPEGKAALHVLSLRFEDKKMFVPLQAADILAYELYKDRPRQHQPEMRRAPLQLLHRGTWQHMTEPNLRALAALTDMLAAGDLTPDAALSAAIWRPLGVDSRPPPAHSPEPDLGTPERGPEPQ